MKSTLKGTAVALIMLMAGCATEGVKEHVHDAFTKHYEGSLFEVTEDGAFSVELVTREHELLTGVNAVDLIIHDRNDKDVIGAEVTVTPWMPDMGHGVFEAPVITEKGGGLYTAENIILTMSGRWELRVRIRSGATEDRAVFDFPDVKLDRGHAHKTIRSPDLSKLDLSSVKLSDKGAFSVSYKSTVEPILVNKIHSWMLTVETPDGKPLGQAEITIDGDMPEHGHGLPTQPEVTEDLGSGHYLIEGMKFSMPGWWVLNLVIRAQGKVDTVTFNLFLRE